MDVAQTLPNAKFILSLRNPIDRAYSEYQMELRRISTQDTFMRSLQDMLPQIADCTRQRVSDLSVRTVHICMVLSDCCFMMT